MTVYAPSFAYVIYTAYAIQHLHMTQSKLVGEVVLYDKDQIWIDFHGCANPARLKYLPMNIYRLVCVSIISP